ncbi:hypothetical protein ACF1BN_37020 [Streptomyces sp. NPDC014861]|uniref:hypothetical protein n=1 Tax=Streptomyces sp. NPDC014861 TaxID=3364923 RepID=UPI0036FF7D63
MAASETAVAGSNFPSSPLGDASISNRSRNQALLMDAHSQASTPGGIGVLLDPQEAFAAFMVEFDTLADLDPDLGWVRQALTSRLEEIPEEDALRVTSLLWPGAKAILLPHPFPWPPVWPPAGFPPLPGYPPWPLWPSWPPPCPGPLPWLGPLAGGGERAALTALRHGLVEGGALRRQFAADLEGPLSVRALRDAARAVQDWQYASTSAQTRDFDQSWDELQRMTAGPERKPGAAAVGVLLVVAAVGVGFGVGYGIAHYASHHQ